MPRKNIPYILNSARKSTIFGFYIALITCVLAPLMVISGNPDDFETLSLSYTFFGIMQKEWLATFLRSSLIAFIAISCQKKCEQIAFCIIIALALFSFYLPVKSGLIDGESLLKFNTINLLLGLTLATIAIRFFKHRHKIILILIAGPLIQSSILIMTNLPQTAQSKARLKPGPVSTTKKNVFIMSYDALQSNSVKQAIDALPQKDRAEFDGFTFYEDVLSHGHNTRASNLLTKIGHSIPPGVTNISQAKNILPKIHHSAESPMEENQHHAMITDKLIAAGYNIETFGHFSNSETQSHYIKSTFETKTDYQQALKASQMKNLTNFLKKRKKKKLPSVFPRLSSMDDYNFNLNNLNPGSIQPVFKLQHYTFSHIPLVFDEKCNYVGYDGNNNTVSSKAQLNSSKCSIMKMLEWIRALKKIGAYDNSIIFLVSDHGIECSKNARTLEFSSLHSCSKLGVHDLSRYSAFMMSKNANNHGNLTFSKTPVSLNDIAKTVCTATINNSQCDIYDGYNLFSDKKPSRNQYRPLAINKERAKYKGGPLKWFHILSPRHITYDAFLDKHRFVNDRQAKRPQVIEFSAHDIPPTTARASNQRLLFTGNQQAYVTNGPYISLIPGKYQFMIRYKNTDTKSNNDSSPSYWEIMSNHGTENLKKIELPKADGKFRWSTQFIHIEKDTNGVGIRVHYGGHGSIEIDHIKIKKLPAN